MIFNTRRILAAIAALTGRFAALEEKVETIMSTIADLNAALDGLDAEIQTATTAILAAVNDLKSKVGPAVDVSAEVARVTTEVKKLQDATAAVQAVDTP